MATEAQLIRDLKRAEARFQRAAKAHRDAALDRSAAFRRASEGGMSLRDIAQAVGVTFGRVHQVMRAPSDEL